MSGPLPDAGIHAWDAVTLLKDANGNLLRREKVWDNGVSTVDIYENGTPAIREWFDYERNTGPSDDPGAHPWQSSYLQYDENGLPWYFEKTFDDGRDLVQTYNNGLLASETFEDNGPDSVGAPFEGSRAWESIETYYIRGVLVDKLTKYDDGAERSEYFRGPDGNRSRTLEKDSETFYGPETFGNHAWSERETLFDEAGLIRERLTTFDDDVSTRQETYANGVISRIENVEYGYDPETFFTTYQERWTLFDEAGVRTAQQQVLVNGDLQFIFYEGGTRDLKVVVDRNDDRPWYARAISYDEGGAFESAETFAAAEDLPTDTFGVWAGDFIV